MRIVFSRHARQRLFERCLAVEAVIDTAENGQTIVRYDDDKPYAVSSWDMMVNGPCMFWLPRIWKRIP